MARADWPTAAARWAELRELDPSSVDAWIHGATAARKLGVLAEANALISAARQQFPADRAVLTASAYDAMHRQDWQQAACLWAALSDREPENAEARNGLASARNQLRFLAMERGEETSDPTSSNAAPWLARFESLGSTCEFGFVQRHFGLEPMGLLRWASVRYPQLAGAVREGFSFLDSATDARVVGGDGEAFLHIDSAGFRAHTGFDKSATHDPQFIPRTITRLRFLRRKFMEDLRSGERIFVYIGEDEREDIEKFRDILSAVQSYAPSPVLFVALGDDARRPGTVRDHGGGLMVGYLTPRPVRWTGGMKIDYQCWQALCAEALRVNNR